MLYPPQQIHLLNPSTVLRHFHALELGVVDLYTTIEVEVYLLNPKLQINAAPGLLRVRS